MNRWVLQSYLYIQSSITLLTISIILFTCPSAQANAARIRQFTSADILARAEGIGSLPAVILRDGTVCLTNKTHPSHCEPLGTLPDSAGKFATDGKYTYFADRQLYSQKYIGTFDGVFDLLGDGKPQVFIDYWPDMNDPNCLAPYHELSKPRWPGEDPCDGIALLVYRQTGKTYSRYLTVAAPSDGYSSGAWFLNEKPRKAIFETRCDGSGGDCLYYLNLSKRSLEQIDGTASLQNPPTIEYLNHDLNASFFVTNRGYDRLAAQGAVLIHWTSAGYRQWWPGWFAPPYVMYAQMADVDNDSVKEIVGVLDTGTDVDQGSSLRALGIWGLTGNAWDVVAKVTLPSTSPGAIVTPRLIAVSEQPAGARIVLSYGNNDTFTCHYADHKLTCPAVSAAAK